MRGSSPLSGSSVASVSVSGLWGLQGPMGAPEDPDLKLGILETLVLTGDMTSQVQQETRAPAQVPETCRFPSQRQS